MKVFENPFLYKEEIIQTRKQTRKFKNKRWNKKYLKYVKVIKHPQCVCTKDSIFAHPIIIEELKKMKMSIDNNEKLYTPNIAPYFYNVATKPFKIIRPDWFLRESK